MRWLAVFWLAACGGGSNDNARADGAPFPAPCSGCSAGYACEAGVGECIAAGSDDCGDRLFGDPVWGNDPFRDLVQMAPPGGVFDETAHGHVTATGPGHLALALDRWGERTLDIDRADLGDLFHVGESVDLRICSEIDRYAVFDRDWLAEIESPAVTLAATGGRSYNHHTSCRPTGVTALGFGPTICAVTPGDRYSGRLGVPAELTFADGSTARAWAGEEVTVGPHTLDLRSSWLTIIYFLCADCSAGDLQFVLVTK